jgi:hypothetical protein
MLLDLAEVLSPPRLVRVIEEAERLRLFDRHAIDRLVERSHGRKGLRRLIPLLGAVDEAPPPTRSELERRFLALCKHEHLPPPEVNVWLAGFEVDALWREQRLVVELDGFAFHGARLAFERDRMRDAAIQLAGYRVLRVTHRRLEAEPGAVAGTVRALLDGAPRASRQDVRESRRNVQPDQRSEEWLTAASIG